MQSIANVGTILSDMIITAAPELRLYWGPGTCSLVAHFALERLRREMGVAYEDTRIVLARREHFAPEFLAVNPRHQVPTLVVDGTPLTQLVAILHYLDHSYPEAELLPRPGPLRWQALSTLLWLNTMVHPNHTRLFRPERFGGETGAAGVAEVARTTFKEALGEIEALCNGARPFHHGDRPDAVDAYFFVVIHWAGLRGFDLAQFPASKAFAERFRATEAGGAVVEKEEL